MRLDAELFAQRGETLVSRGIGIPETLEQELLRVAESNARSVNATLTALVRLGLRTLKEHEVLVFPPGSGGESAPVRKKPEPPPPPSGADLKPRARTLDLPVTPKPGG